MKIRIAYGPDERLAAAAVKTTIEKLLPDIAVQTPKEERSSYRHIYMTTPKDGGTRLKIH